MKKKISISPDQQKKFFIIGRRVPKGEKEKRMQQTAEMLTATATHGQPDEPIIDSVALHCDKLFIFVRV